MRVRIWIVGSLVLWALWTLGSAWTPTGDGVDGWGNLDVLSPTNVGEIETAIDDNAAQLSNLGNCASSPCALADGTVVAADMANGSHGAFTYTSGVAAINANALALGTATTGNYVATLADSGASEVTVSGSGTEAANVTLAIAEDIARDAEATTFCESGGIDSANNTDRIIPGKSYAITITEIRCAVEGAVTPSITFNLNECNSSGTSCTASTPDAIGTTCNGGIDSDTTFTDAAFDADDAWQIDTGAATGDNAVDYIAWTICYTRQVVE